MIEKKIKRKDLKLINCGAESLIYLYNGKILKSFQHGGKFKSNYLEMLVNKKLKLEVLAYFNFPHHPQIYDLYSARFNFKKTFYAYTMQYLKNNMIKKYITENSENKIMLLNKVWENTKLENKNSIYNFDIKINNLYIQDDGKLFTLDIDNLQVINYQTDLYLKLTHDFILKNKPTSDNIQNFSMLMFMINIVFNCKAYSYPSLSDLKKALPNIICDNDKFLEKAYNICDNKEEDIKELIYLATR